MARHAARPSLTHPSSLAQHYSPAVTAPQSSRPGYSRKASRQVPQPSFSVLLLPLLLTALLLSPVPTTGKSFGKVGVGKTPSTSKPTNTGNGGSTGGSVAIKRPMVVTQSVYVPRTYLYSLRIGPSYNLNTVLLLLFLTSSMHRADARFQYNDGKEQYCPILVNPQANYTDELAYNTLQSVGPTLQYDNQDVAAYNATLYAGTNQTLYVSQQCSQLEASTYPPPPPGGGATPHGPNVLLAWWISSAAGMLLLLAALQGF